MPQLSLLMSKNIDFSVCFLRTRIKRSHLVPSQEHSTNDLAEWCFVVSKIYYPKNWITITFHIDEFQNFIILHGTFWNWDVISFHHSFLIFISFMSFGVENSRRQSGKQFRKRRKFSITKTVLNNNLELHSNYCIHNKQLPHIPLF